MVGKNTRGQRLEGERAGFTWGNLDMGGAATWARGRVEVDGVDDRTVGIIAQFDLDGIANPDAKERARNCLVEGPVCVAGAVGQAAFELYRPSSTWTRCGAVRSSGRGRLAGSWATSRWTTRASA